MNIMMPPRRDQPSPAPWLVRFERIDVPRLIEEALAQTPEASVDQMVAHLAEHRHVQASGIIVSMLISKRKQHAVGENKSSTHLVGIRTLRQRLAEVRVPEWAGLL